MRVIKPTRLKEYATRHVDAERPLQRWLELIEAGSWESIDALHRVFPTADGVTCERRTLTVFNIKGNKYRLIVAIHYNTKKVFVRHFMTHAAYDKGNWKENP